MAENTLEHDTTLPMAEAAAKVAEGANERVLSILCRLNALDFLLMGARA
jgi:hypothetical protein